MYKKEQHVPRCRRYVNKFLLKRRTGRALNAASVYAHRHKSSVWPSAIAVQCRSAPWSTLSGSPAASSRAETVPYRVDRLPSHRRRATGPRNLHERKHDTWYRPATPRKHPPYRCHADGPDKGRYHRFCRVLPSVCRLCLRT